MDLEILNNQEQIDEAFQEPQKNLRSVSQGMTI